MKKLEPRLAKYLKDILPTVNAQFINMNWLAGKISTFIDKEGFLLSGSKAPEYDDDDDVDAKLFGALPRWRCKSCRRLYERYNDAVNCCQLYYNSKES